MCTCTECLRKFSGISIFDKHRVNTTGQPGYDAEYDWRCATDDEMASKGLHEVDGAWKWKKTLDPAVFA